MGLTAAGARVKQAPVTHEVDYAAIKEHSNVRRQRYHFKYGIPEKIPFQRGLPKTIAQDQQNELRGDTGKM